MMSLFIVDSDNGIPSADRTNATPSGRVTNFSDMVLLFHSAKKSVSLWSGVVESVNYVPGQNARKFSSEYNSLHDCSHRVGFLPTLRGKFHVNICAATSTLNLARPLKLLEI